MSDTIRLLINKLGEEIEPLGTVTSFVDDSPNLKVVTSEKPLLLTASSWVNFDSITYNDEYQPLALFNDGFSVAVTFTEDDPNISYYDVTPYVQALQDATNIVNAYKCVANNPNLDSIIFNYALYLLSTNSDSNIKSISIKNQQTITMKDNEGAKNPYFIIADNLSGGCLSGKRKRRFIRALPSGRGW